MLAAMKWVAATLLSLSLLLGAAALLGFNQRFSLLYSRQTPANEGLGTTTRAYRTPPKHRRIDFSGNPGVDNLWFASNPEAADDMLQLDDPHPLTLEHLGERARSMTSYNTFIAYARGTLSWVRIYPGEDPCSYRNALRVVGRTMTRLGFAEVFDIAEYDQHLDEPINGSEPWIPRVELGGFELLLYLNCDWAWESTARAQINKVQCHPYLYIQRAPAVSADAATR